jgi:hypothetical protein
MISLANQENLGCVSSDTVVPKYDLTGKKAPRFILRSVELLNEYDHVFRDGAGFRTDQDAPVTNCKRLMSILQWIIAATLIVGPRLWPWWERTHDLGVFLVIGMLAIVIAVGFNLVIKFILGESVTDFMASRIMGAPARPRLYVQEGIDRGQVRRRDQDQKAGAASDNDAVRGTGA